MAFHNVYMDYSQTTILNQNLENLEINYYYF